MTRWPTEPHLVLWQARTALRESRGDGHVAALTVAGLGPVEALVLAGVALDLPRLREVRGWSEEEWTATVTRFTDRGLLSPAGELTAAGRAVRDEAEARTDALADRPWAVVGAPAAERLVGLVAPLVAAIVASGGLPAGNPIGVSPLAP